VKRPRGDGDGFTLVELTMAVAITGIITSVIAACVIVGLKTTDATASRLAESHDAQLVSTYLAADVQSASESGVDTAAATDSGCGAVGDEGTYSGGANVLRLSWTQDQPAPAVSYVASYRRAKNVATGEWQLLRITCTNHGTGSSITVARQLADPAVSPPVVDVGHPPAVSLTLNELSGYRYSVAAVRRSPSTSGLPAVPWACTVQSALTSPDPVLRTTAAPGPLASDLAVDVQSGGACSALTVTVSPGGSADYNRSLTQSPAGSGHWATTLSKSTGTWTDGSKAFSIRQFGTLVGTMNITVKQPCLITSFALSPNPARRTPGAAPGALAADESITATSTGPCLPLLVDGPPRPGATPLSVTLTQSSPGTWAGSIARDAAAWSDGQHVFSIHEGSDDPIMTASLLVTPNCVATGTATPSPVGRGNGNGTKSHQLTADVTVTALTTGACGTLTATLSPGAAVVSKLMTGGPSGPWSTTFGATEYSWTPGSKTISLIDADGDVSGTLVLVVQ
jgi:prepilin-type N-terminal cleavage/methylation domain-containing protein